MRSRDEVLPSVVEAIADTPVVRLSRLTKELDGEIVAKLDYLNPGHSRKDRVARQIIEDAEEQGELRPGQTVVELTSGNTGTGLAIVCAVKDYPFVAVMSRGNSPERARMMRALGADVILVDQAAGSSGGTVSGEDLDLVEEVTRQIEKERGAFRADQFAHPGGTRAHAVHTAVEFLAQTCGKIDAFCDFVGSGGSFAGCSMVFKSRNPSIKCYVVEPTGAAVLAGGLSSNLHHRIQGGGYSRRDLPHLRGVKIDGFLSVSDEQAVECARNLACKEGIFAGFSTGANLAAAIQLLRGELRGKTIAIIVCDSGMKYLSTDLWPGA